MAFPIRVNDVMSSPVRTATPDTTADEAAATCREDGVGSLVVVENGDVVGIVTSDDFVRLLGDVSEPTGCPLRKFMSTEVVTVTADTPIGDAVEIMFDNDIARLVIVEDGSLEGLVSSNDIVRYVPQIFRRYEFDYTRPDSIRSRIPSETAYELSGWETDAIGLSDSRITVGDRVEFTKALTERDVRAFATASGDTNRLHLDDEYARATRFGRRIVHGTLVGGVISAALARFPGVTIYVSENLTFLSPVELGDRVTAICEIIEDIGRGKYQLTTDVVDSKGERVIEGQAVVLIDESRDV
ncbi:putative signal transduction protein with CBS domains [Haloterrigena salina JCM 13891]|uniref:Putative signal transduction protein with CBS domains n=2 Tax=Haloterrigena salina TaxID=504937 RepID=M0CRL5_9EURY|nr:putative signal transduction protein with CBS domains [Haloterrigena salina JCM 13891]